MLDSVTLEIGGQQVDKHFGHWMEAHAELTEENPTVAPAAVSAQPIAGHTKFQGGFSWWL